MNLTLRSLLWTVLAVVLSGLTAHFVASRSGSASSVSGHHHHESPADSSGDPFHDWLHQKLGITPEQEERLAPFEEAFGKSRAELLARSEAAGRRLSDALVATPTDRAALDAALAEIHAAQGELQRITISHFLEMKDQLSPDQADRLLHWTRDSIVHEHHP